MSLEVKVSQYSSQINTTKRVQFLQKARTNLDSISQTVIQKTIPHLKKAVESASEQNYSQLRAVILEGYQLILDAKAKKEEYYAEGGFAKLCNFCQNLFKKVFGRETPLDRVQRIITDLDKLAIELDGRFFIANRGAYEKHLGDLSLPVEETDKDKFFEEKASLLATELSDWIKGKDKEAWKSIVQKGWEGRENFSMQAVQEGRSVIVTSKDQSEVKFLYSPNGKCFVIFEDHANLISKGLSKCVYKAVDLDTGEQAVSSKWKKDDRDEDDSHATRSMLDDFSKESFIYNTIKNEGVVPQVFARGVYQTDKHSYDAYMISEYYDGNIAKLELEEMRDLDRLNIMKDSAKAFSVFHAKGISHGDIKLENILYKVIRSAKGLFQRFKVVVIDFGLAHCLQEKMKTVSGTSMYLSPEKCKAMNDQSQKKVDEVNHPSNDVWSFGIVCYQLWRKENPAWSEMSPKAMVNHIAKLKEDWFVPQQGDPVELMIAKMLSIDPAKRPSMKEVAEFFDRYFMEEFILQSREKLNKTG